jgi:hypothetical protein
MNHAAWEFRNEQFKAFERIIKLTEEQQIDLLLIQAPITKVFILLTPTTKNLIN